MDSETSSAQSALLVGLLVMPVLVVIAVVLGVVGGVLWLAGAAAPAASVPTTPAASVAPAADPASMRLVIVNPRGQLVTMTADGQERSVLTEGDYRFQFPAWSPDGRWIAAIANSLTESGVFILTPDGAAPTIVYEDSRDIPIYLSWSPDSAQVSFIANHPADGIALYLAPADGGGSQLVTTGQPFYWDWTGDSASLLLHTGFVGSNPRLTFWDVAQATAGEALSAPGYFQSPDLSPSGRYIAYASENGADERQITVVERATGHSVQAPHRGLAALAWSPAADTLAYIAGVGETETFFGPLRLLDPATGAVSTLSADLVVAFFWSPDGRTLAYLTPHGAEPRSRDLARPADPMAPRPTLRLIQEERGVTLDLWLVDVASGEARLNSAFQPSTLFLAQFLPFFDQYARSHRVWAPDSQSLVLPTTSDGLAFIARFFTDGRPPDLVTLGFSAFWTWQ